MTEQDKPRLYAVWYWLFCSGGSPEDRISYVLAYDAKDAEYQASIEPKQHVTLNPAWQFSIRKIEPATIESRDSQGEKVTK